MKQNEYGMSILVTSITALVLSNLVHGEVYTIPNYVIKFVSNLRQVGAFLRVLWFPPFSHVNTELTCTFSLKC
jgi:hypothetical protein